MRRYSSAANYVVVALVALAVGAAGGVAFGMSRADDNADMLAPLETANVPKVPTACSTARLVGFPWGFRSRIFERRLP